MLVVFSAANCCKVASPGRSFSARFKICERGQRLARIHQALKFGIASTRAQRRSVALRKPRFRLPQSLRSKRLRNNGPNNFASRSRWRATLPESLATRSARIMRKFRRTLVAAVRILLKGSRSDLFRLYRGVRTNLAKRQ